MNKKIKYMTFAIGLMVLASSCINNKKPNSSTESKNSTETILSKKTKYTIKSGIVEYKAQMMGMDYKQLTYFDEYGGKETIELAMQMTGMDAKSITIMKDGYMYNFNPVEKTGTKNRISEKTGNIDFQNLSKEIQEEMNIKKVGEETFLGKPCIKFSIDDKSLKMKGYYLVWKGVALKTDITMSTAKIYIEAINIQENVAIPAERFEIPADIKFK